MAGNTAMSSAIKPQPAARRTGGSSSPNPPATSATPLMNTSKAGVGRYGGMIFRYSSGRTKWPMPATTKNTAASQRRRVCMNFTRDHTPV